MSDLKPCPFCGGEAEIERYTIKPYVACMKCGCSMPDRHQTAEQAIEAWNSRVECTCAMIPSFTKPATLDDCQEFCCSACGEYMVLQQFPGCADDVPNYCPNCGRKCI